MNNQNVEQNCSRAWKSVCLLGKNLAKQYLLGYFFSLKTVVKDFSFFLINDSGVHYLQEVVGMAVEQYDMSTVII